MGDAAESEGRDPDWRCFEDIHEWQAAGGTGGGRKYSTFIPDFPAFPLPRQQTDLIRRPGATAREGGLCRVLWRKGQFLTEETRRTQSSQPKGWKAATGTGKCFITERGGTRSFGYQIWSANIMRLVPIIRRPRRGRWCTTITHFEPAAGGAEGKQDRAARRRSRVRWLGGGAACGGERGRASSWKCTGGNPPEKARLSDKGPRGLRPGARAIIWLRTPCGDPRQRCGKGW